MDKAMFCLNGCDCVAHPLSGIYFEQFCRNCGNKLVERALNPATNTKCQNCKAGGVLANDKFCGTCGCVLPPRCFMFIFKDPMSLLGFAFIIADNFAGAEAVLRRSSGPHWYIRYTPHTAIELPILGKQ